MSTSLVIKEPAAVAVTPEQAALARRTYAPTATDDEWTLYCYDCARNGVHPMDKLIHFTKRSGKYTPITSIDFMRQQAAATGEYAGSDDTAFVGTAPSQEFAAQVTVWRIVAGVRCPFTATARWSEYKPEANDFMWRKMPHTMLGKCAEALALRKGFPKQLAGLYAREEMDQADSGGLVVEAPKSRPAPTQALPEAIDTTTGEVTHHETVEPAAPPPGYVTIDRCESLNGKGKKAGVVHFSDGTNYAVWMTDSRVFDGCLEWCQLGTPVRYTLTPSKNDKYPPTLKAVETFKPRASDDGPVMFDMDDPPDEAPPFISDKDIPF